LGDIVVGKICLVTTFLGWLSTFDVCWDLKIEVVAYYGCIITNPT